jgi:hypothetical protein
LQHWLICQLHTYVESLFSACQRPLSLDSSGLFCLVWMCRLYTMAFWLLNVSLFSCFRRFAFECTLLFRHRSVRQHRVWCCEAVSRLLRTCEGVNCKAIDVRLGSRRQRRAARSEAFCAQCSNVCRKLWRARQILVLWRAAPSMGMALHQ